MKDASVQKDRSPARIGYFAAVVVTLALLVAVHLHPVWRPWTRGVVTGEFVEILWAIDLSLGVQLVANAVLFVTHPRWLRRLSDLATAVFSGLSVLVAYIVYPFDFARIAGGVDLAARVLMLLLLFAITIAVIVDVFRLLAVPFTHDDSAVPH